MVRAEGWIMHYINECPRTSSFSIRILIKALILGSRLFVSIPGHKPQLLKRKTSLSYHHIKGAFKCVKRLLGGVACVISGHGITVFAWTK